ncbi:sodium:calcium antiporter [Patescibacteria group bacterium]|nr:sodium:calcium antiporter [Patescibacteria group bacterium]MBU2579915.1 sodium:calcium antiporter [Patescibacteria group bacterium]MBU4031006.1 sodium:calcium antiporter [Patescibacteria group bacterium]MBU4082355.1 sodium:calcium antiporter [Patescibacteria group bacterium]MCG2809073.1 sodium:calcium antiporter [Candidatus Portnoybacteria bacterium]
MILNQFLIFVVSFLVLIFSSKWLVGALTKIAKFFGWKEFIVAFFTMALASSIPNLSVGLSSALRGISHLSFGEIVGGNIIDLTVTVALAALVSRNGLRVSGKTVQVSAVFTLIIAILPLILIFDGNLSRPDGVVLIFAFLIYSFWLFRKKERFSKAYNHNTDPITAKSFFKGLGGILAAVALLLFATEGIVNSAVYFSSMLGLPLTLVGMFAVSIGNTMPEIFFSIQAAKKGKDWMVLGNLLGAVILPVTLVLGIVVLIHPIEITNFSPFVIARFFLVISAMFFLIFSRTGKRVSKKEAIFLLLVYLSFIVAEFLFGQNG